MRNNKPKGYRLERIENVAATGTPDVHGKYGGKDFWLELKETKLPKRLTSRFLTRHELSAAQINWHITHRQCGMKNNFIAVRDDKKNLYLFDGDFAEQLNSLDVQTAQKFLLNDWISFYEALIT